MARQSENLKRSLFEEDKARVVLPPAQMSELAKLLEVLLLEIARALANGEIGNDQDND
jgi:hypothetical protein